MSFFIVRLLRMIFEKNELRNFLSGQVMNSNKRFSLNFKLFMTLIKKQNIINTLVFSVIKLSDRNLFVSSRLNHFN